MSFQSMASRTIHVSGRFLRIAQPTGTQRSARRLFEATCANIDRDIALYSPKDQPTGAMGHGKWQIKPLPGKKKIWDHLWEQLVLPFHAKGGVIWTLMGTGPVFHHGSLHVMVVHDLNFISIPKAFSPQFRWWYRFACSGAARNADVVLCFSSYVRNSLQKALGVDPDKIHVVPQGPGLAGIDAPKRAISSNPETPYFLCVGSLQPHKNLEAILQAWQIFSPRFPTHRLKVVGRKQERFAKLSLPLSLVDQPHVEFTGYVDDSALIALYSAAQGFIYPSLEEGFGLPVVEAFYCGCPVITSNRSCLPEIAGGAALLIDPDVPEEIAAAMDRFALNKDERTKWIEAGYQRAKDFTWTKAGQLVADILTRVSQK